MNVTLFIPFFLLTLMKLAEQNLIGFSKDALGLLNASSQLWSE